MQQVFYTQNNWAITDNDEEARFFSLYFKMAAADAFFSPCKIDDSIICSTQQ